MLAKVIIFCVALATAHTSLIAPVGYGTPVIAAGPLGIGKGLITTPAVATVSSQKAVINHVAPAASVAVAPAPIGVTSHGILANGLVGSHGIAAAPLAVGAGIYGLPFAVGVGNLGHGHGAVVSSQKSVINHVAPAAPVAVVAAPFSHASHGIYGNGLLANGIVGGHGIAAAPLSTGHGLLGAPVALGHGKIVSSQKSVINHAAPAAPVAVAAAPVALASHGIYGKGLLANGIVGGHGIAAAPLATGHGLLSAPIAHGHGNTVSSQKSVISHVAPAAPVAVAAAPVALASDGIYGNGLLANGIVGGHGIAAAPLAAGHGLLGAPVALGHGTAVSSQKSIISHVAPAARVAVAAAPLALGHNGILNNGLIGGHGIVGNSLVAGAPLGFAGHGISALPLSIGSSIHGSPVALGFGKSIL
ncbi:hypothetical protein HNY73_009230 [Argiope bruennichi]|uniref:Uncharacterized protein n=1 Tax=Argiope bruennichi TaxID=94029 RepID=A0A8T0FFG1_ARGBR|nr:hypothetical protein HNY73_009230 [Argiope bruennichi]